MVEVRGRDVCALLTPLESYRLISDTHFWLLRYDNKNFRLSMTAKEKV